MPTVWPRRFRDVTQNGMMGRSMASSAALPRISPYAPFLHGDFTLYQLARIFLIIGGQVFIVALQWQG